MNMTKRDYYDVLGIGRNADEKEIKRAYRKLAKQYHPDTNPGDKQAEQRFKEITEAYNVLSDKEKRAAYNQFGFAAFDEGAAGGSAHRRSCGPAARRPYHSQQPEQRRPHERDHRPAGNRHTGAFRE